MLKFLTPDMYVDSIFNIPLKELRDMGIKGLIIDLDNTITTWNGCEVSQRVRDWFVLLCKSGFKVCIASNNSKERVVQVAEKLGIPYIAKAGKPRRWAFKHAMEIIGTEKNSTAVIGDQVFTDVLGGNRIKIFTILVVPLGTSEFFGTKLMRFFERLVLKIIAARGKTKEITRYGNIN